MYYFYYCKWLIGRFVADKVPLSVFEAGLAHLCKKFFTLDKKGVSDVDKMNAGTISLGRNDENLPRPIPKKSIF